MSLVIESFKVCHWSFVHCVRVIEDFCACHCGAFKVCHWSLRALRFVIGHLFTAFASLRIFVLVIGELLRFVIGH